MQKIDSGLTGTRIIEAILDGVKDPEKFASLVHGKCKKSPKEIADSLMGNYRDEYLFALKQAKDLYEYYTIKIKECEEQIEETLKELVQYTQHQKELKQEQINDRAIAL